MKKLILTLLLVSYWSISSAAILERDFVQNSNDKLLTYDSSTNLEWLDLTYTQGRSVFEIQNNWGGLLDKGFRYATLNDLTSFIGSFGLSINKNYTTAAYNANSDTIFSVTATQSLIDLVHTVGVTLTSSNAGVIQQEWSYGIFAYDKPDEFNRFPFLGIGYQSTGIINSGIYTSRTPIDSLKSSYGEFGNFLVRNAAPSTPSPIPEPSTSTFLFLGLAIIIYWNRKNLLRN